jgi:hypothetical protein
MSKLADVYDDEGKYPQAEALYSQTLEIERRVLGPEHPNTLVSMDNLADVYERLGKYPQAEALHSQVLEIRRRVLGPEHPDTLASMGNLADVYAEEGKYAQAEALGSQALEIKRHVLGPEHFSTLASITIWQPTWATRPSMRRPRHSSIRPCPPRGGCWVPRIRTLSRCFQTSHPCTRGNANMSSQRPTPHRPWRGGDTP